MKPRRKRMKKKKVEIKQRGKKCKRKKRWRLPDYPTCIWRVSEPGKISTEICHLSVFSLYTIKLPYIKSGFSNKPRFF